jgi:hypothetical protein
VLLLIHLLPQHVALVRRQGFQRIGDIGGGQAVDQPGQLAGLIPQLLSCTPCGSSRLSVRASSASSRVRMRSVLFTLFGAVLGGEGHEAEFLNSVVRLTHPIGYQTQNKRL